MLWTSYLVRTDGWTDKQTDRRTDGQTNHCRGPAEQGPKNDWDKRQNLFIYVLTEWADRKICLYKEHRYEPCLHNKNCILLCIAYYSTTDTQFSVDHFGDAFLKHLLMKFEQNRGHSPFRDKSVRLSLRHHFSEAYNIIFFLFTQSGLFLRQVTLPP